MMVKKNHRFLLKLQKGVVSVEAALSAALFFILLLIIFDLLWVLYSCVMGQFVVNQAGRMAAVQRKINGQILNHDTLFNQFIKPRLRDLNIKTEEYEFLTCTANNRTASGPCASETHDLTENSRGLLFINLVIKNPGLIGLINPRHVISTVARIEDK